MFFQYNSQIFPSERVDSFLCDKNEMERVGYICMCMCGECKPFPSSNVYELIPNFEHFKCFLLGGSKSGL